jgi:hypothetical protein
MRQEMKTTHLSPRFKKKMTTLFRWIAIAPDGLHLFWSHTCGHPFCIPDGERNIHFVPQLFFKPIIGISGETITEMARLF